MANNMIALQARAPQTNFIGNAIRQNAQMINMMRQQDAADRQAAAAAKNAEIAAAQEARAATKEGRDIATFELDRDAKIYAKHRAAAPAVAQGGPEVYALWLDDYRKDNPKVAAIIEKAMPVDQFNADKFILMMGTMDQRFDARYGKAITKELIGPGGEMFGANISGIPGASYATPLPDISKPLTGGRTAPRGDTPPAAMPAPSEIPGGRLRATQGVNTRPEDLLSQGQPANRIPSGSPFSPISDTGAAQPDLGGIVQQMMQTGVVSQSNLQALRAAAGPDKEQQLAQLMRSSNIKIMPDEQQFGGMQSAVYRPGEGDASAAQVQYNPNDYAQVRVKSPMQSPETSIPGSAKVPIKRVREEAQASEEGKVAGQTAADRVRSRAEQKRAAENFFRVVGMKPGDKNDPVANLIKRSTSGAIEAVGAELVGAIPESIGGGATEGAQAIGELQTIAAKLTNDLLGGKLGTGISNEDRKMIERLVGDIANPYIAADKRLAAWRRVKQIQASYLGAPSTPVQKRVVRTGTLNGRRVVKYSDGTIDYAD